MALRPFKVIKPLAEKQSVGGVPIAEAINGVVFTVTIVIAAADAQLPAMLLMIKL